MLGILGAILLFLLLAPCFCYGLVAWSPHRWQSCPCEGCQRRRDRSWRETRQRYGPGQIVMTGAEWDAWQEETGLEPDQYAEWAAKHGHWPAARIT